MHIDEIIKSCHRQQDIAGVADAAVVFEVRVELEPPAFGQQVALWEGDAVGDVVGYDYEMQVAQVVWAADELLKWLEGLRLARNG